MGFFSGFKSRKEKEEEMDEELYIELMTVFQHSRIYVDSIKIIESTTNPDTFFSRYQLMIDSIKHAKEAGEWLKDEDLKLLLDFKLDVRMAIVKSEQVMHEHFVDFLDRVLEAGKFEQLKQKMPKYEHLLPKDTLQHYRYVMEDYEDDLRIEEEERGADPGTWEYFSENYFSWEGKELEREISRIKSLGSSDDVMEILQSSLEAEEEANLLLQRTLDEKMQFRTSDVVELTDNYQEKLVIKAIESSLYDLEYDDLQRNLAVLRDQQDIFHSLYQKARANDVVLQINDLLDIITFCDEPGAFIETYVPDADFRDADEEDILDMLFDLNDWPSAQKCLMDKAMAEGIQFSEYDLLRLEHYMDKS